MLPAPPHDDQVQIFEILLADLLLGERVVLLVLEPAVGFADDAEIVPIEVAAPEQLAALVVDPRRRLRCREAEPRDDEAADRFEGRLGAAVREGDGTLRPMYPRPVPTESQY